MALPQLNTSGDLPVGLHRASPQETIERFGIGSPQRVAVADRLQRVYHLATGTGFLARFIVFGSFITDKFDPNDVDVLLIMSNEFDSDQVRGESALIFDHPAADAHLGPASSGYVDSPLLAANNRW